MAVRIVQNCDKQIKSYKQKIIESYVTSSHSKKNIDHAETFSESTVSTKNSNTYNKAKYNISTLLLTSKLFSKNNKV